jgi:hypothetical protein
MEAECPCIVGTGTSKQVVTFQMILDIQGVEDNKFDVQSVSFTETFLAPNVMVCSLIQCHHYLYVVILPIILGAPTHVRRGSVPKNRAPSPPVIRLTCKLFVVYMCTGFGAL